MAIDPNIAMGFRMPDFVGQAVALRRVGLEQQLGQQQLQRGDQDLQEGQMRLQDIGQKQAESAALRQALSDATVTGPDGTPTVDRKKALSSLAQAGHGDLAMNLNQKWTEQDATAEQQKAALTKEQLGNAAAHVERLSKGLQGILTQPTDEAKHQAYSRTRAGMIAEGTLKEGSPEDPGEAYPGDAVIGSYLAQSMDQKDTLAQQLAEKKAAEEAEHNRALEAQAAAAAAQTAENQKLTRQQEQQRIELERKRLALEQNKAGLDANGSVSTLAGAIAQGHITPDKMGYLLSKNPELLQGVMQADPAFDSSKAQSYPAVYKDFTSGATAKALNAGGTALGHLQELKNMNTPESHIPGTAAYNAYMNKVDTVATELAKFYGDSTVSGISAIRGTLASQLPGTRDAAIKTQAQSMGDKLDAYQQQWDNAAPSKAYQAPMPGISPKAQKARASLAGVRAPSAAAAGISVTAPDGSVHTFRDQASADKFKQLAGIK